MTHQPCTTHCGLSGDRCECLKAFLAKQAGTDLDRFKAAADALAEAVTHEREMVCQDIAMQIASSDAVDAALTEYRAARAAIEPATSE